MKRYAHGTMVALATLLVLGWILAPFGSGEEKKARKNVLSDAAVRTPALVNFNAELGLSFSSLGELSNRIRVARTEPDPVALAVAARELEVAERVAGKKASVTAETLTAEAVELARARYDAQELEAVALLLGKQELSDLAKKAAKAAAEKKEAIASGEKTRGINGTLTVYNDNTFWGVKVYINGRYRGEIPAGGDRDFDVRDIVVTTSLYAKCNSGVDTWHRKISTWNVQHYEWELKPWKR